MYYNINKYVNCRTTAQTVQGAAPPDRTSRGAPLSKATPPRTGTPTRWLVAPGPQAHPTTLTLHRPTNQTNKQPLRLDYNIHWTYYVWLITMTMLSFVKVALKLVVTTWLWLHQSIGFDVATKLGDNVIIILVALMFVAHESWWLLLPWNLVTLVSPRHLAT